MNRWWSDPSSSVEILKSIDDSDVVQGVGSAFLGYHGLSMGALKPLFNETLLDVLTVRQTLNSVDLSPVAEAISKAVKPIMGDASDEYGKLLAQDVHERAVDATHRLLMTWTNNDVSWPDAIERASEVHGVPIERLGRYATVMKSKGISPIVRADYADRALMDYASEIGGRESLLDTSISKSRATFDESEHPRGGNGRFVDKVKENVENIRNLRNMREARGTTRRVSETKAEAKPKSTFVFTSSPEKQTTPLNNRSVGNRVSSINRVDPASMRRSLEDNLRRTFSPNRVSNVLKQGEIWDRTSYVPVSKDVFEQIKKQGSFKIEQLGELNAFKDDSLIDYLNNNSVGLDNIVVLKIVGAAIQTDTKKALTSASGFGNMFDDVYQAELHPKSRYTFEGQGFYEDMLPLSGGYMEVPVDVHEVQLTNYEDYLSDGEYGRDNFVKKSDGFKENEHPRSADGRFRNKNVQQQKPLGVTDIRQLRNLREQRKTVERRVAEIPKETKGSENKKFVFNANNMTVNQRVVSNSRVDSANRVTGNRIVNANRIQRMKANPKARFDNHEEVAYIASWQDVSNINNPFSGDVLKKIENKELPLIFHDYRSFIKRYETEWAPTRAPYFTDKMFDNNRFVNMGDLADEIVNNQIIGHLTDEDISLGRTSNHGYFRPTPPGVLRRDWEFTDRSLVDLNPVSYIKYLADNMRTEDPTAEFEIPAETLSGIAEAEKRKSEHDRYMYDRAAWQQEEDPYFAYDSLLSYVETTAQDIDLNGWATGLMEKYKLGNTDEHGDLMPAELDYQLEARYNANNETWTPVIAGYDPAERFYCLSGSLGEIIDFKENPYKYDVVKDENFSYLHDMVNLMPGGLDNITYDKEYNTSNKFTDPQVEVYRLKKKATM